MICCDKCQDKQKATHTVAWIDVVNPLKFEDYMVLCDKCYKEFMTLFGNFKGSKFAK